ncbi:hypothetical protein GlitD10_0532 [Gloeomargarita lithophora Alchichica-D10]|uniref:Uncharacterized protein n=1 Tax=Gloeomargarita lithophora Alchichica-D10 TaxID=1188229 RepID=A0A1J0AA88_9CYAN|nr:hypothetical protein [Gloeomargarita lithophora]APB32846.1 hypothetical protein GlitD10_0532 [Gloeomargarita lithophora Alchichica-D10]
MDSVFDELLETLETGLSHNMPEQAKFIFLGRIFEALSRGDIDNKQAIQLEEKLALGERKQYEILLQYASIGQLIL